MEEDGKDKCLCCDFKPIQLLMTCPQENRTQEEKNAGEPWGHLRLGLTVDGGCESSKETHGQGINNRLQRRALGGEGGADPSVTFRLLSQVSWKVYFHQVDGLRMYNWNKYWRNSADSP